MLMAARMQPVEPGIEFGIEGGHIGETFRRFQFEDADQAVIAIERFVARILEQAVCRAHQGKADLVAGHSRIVRP